MSTITEHGPETIGERLARLAKERGLTQEKLAEKIGWSQGRISDYSRGRKVPSIASLNKLAKALNLDLLDLLQGVSLPE